ncbi:MAG TPA: MBL fold metallo-hydrolase [Caulobacteraceae bacterium]|nr:MBL fold metallo-hydrolase [Caulobacteraceae bacterium]
MTRQDNRLGGPQSAQVSKALPAKPGAFAWIPAVLALCGAATQGHAQAPAAPAPAPAPAAAPTPAPPTLQLHALSPTVYWGKEGGSNVALVIGDNGVILFDTTSSKVRGAHLIAEIAKVTPKPVNVIVLSHLDGDHVGGLSAFPKGVEIIAQTETAKALTADATAGRGRVPVDYLPNHVVQDRETLTRDGVKFELIHWAPAHTAGDLAMYLPDQKIVFTGDIFAFDLPRPFVKPEFNGTVDGWIKSAQGVLALDADTFVIGHGDIQTKATLRPFVDTAVKERDEIKALIAKGETLQQIEEAVGDPGNIEPAKLPPIFEPYSQIVYEQLTQKK